MISSIAIIQTVTRASAIMIEPNPGVRAAATIAAVLAAAVTTDAPGDSAGRRKAGVRVEDVDLRSRYRVQRIVNGKQ